MADAVNSQITVETGKHAVLKLTNVSDGTGETNVLKANVANLKFSFSTVNTNSVFNEVPDPTKNFVVGETVFAGANTSSTAQVADYGTSQLLLINIVNPGDWTAGQTITGVTSNTVATQNGAMVSGTQRVSIIGMQWSVSKPVVISWESSSANVVAVTLTGQGEWNSNLTPEYIIPNNATNPTGNINLSTKGFANLDTYSIMLDLRKVAGFQEPRTERNRLPGVIAQ